MTIKIIGISNSFSHFSVGQEINADIKYLDGKMHELIINETKHIIEITNTIFTNNKKIIIEAFISDNINVGKIALEFNY